MTMAIGGATENTTAGELTTKNNRWSVLTKCKNAITNLLELFEEYSAQNGTSVSGMQVLSTQLFDALFATTLCKGQCRLVMLKIVSNHFRKNVFSPNRILKATDDNVTLNY